MNKFIKNRILCLLLILSLSIPIFGVIDIGQALSQPSHHALGLVLNSSDQQVLSNHPYKLKHRHFKKVQVPLDQSAAANSCCVQAPSSTTTTTATTTDEVAVEDVAATIDWSGSMPAPGDQGAQGSCTAWSMAYAYKSYQEQVNRAWGLSTNNHLFSPAYLYNQKATGNNSGMSPVDAANILVQQGCDTLDDMPYNQYDYTTKPTATQIANAGNYKDLSWESITSNSTDALKDSLQSGPIQAASLVYWGTGWDQSGDIAYSDLESSQATLAGVHSICMVGYDDSHVTGDGTGAFKFLNSWGTGWGHNGYGWISYKYAQNELQEAITLTDNAPVNTFEEAGNVTAGSNVTTLPNATLTFSSNNGTAPASVTSSASGAWSQTGFVSGITYTVTPSAPGYTFAPTSAIFTGAATDVNFVCSETVSTNISLNPITSTVQTGNPLTIGWTYTGTPDNITLQLLANGQPVQTIGNNLTPGANGYTWQVPGTIAAGSYQILLTAGALTSTSNTFTITVPAPTLTITSPTSSTTAQAGNPLNVVWSYTGNPSNLNITLLSNGNAVSPVASNVAASAGSYSWTIPSGTPAGNYQVQLTAGSLTVISDAFKIAAIAAPTITITSPISSTVVHVGETLNVSWVYTGSPSNLNIALISNGNVVRTITSNYLASKKGYSWTIPSGTPTGNYQVQISGSNFSTVTSNTFPVSSNSTITITNPVSQMVFDPGDALKIIWTYTGAPGKLKINLVQNGQTVQAIAQSVGVATGKYVWTLPKTLTSGSYQVQIFSANGATAISGAFTVIGEQSLEITGPTSSSLIRTKTKTCITWSHTGYINKINLQLIANGKVVQTIGTNISANMGIYTWSVPANLQSGSYQIKITNTANSAVTAISPTFSLIGISPTITVANLTYKSALKGRSFTVSWKTTGDVGNVNVQLLKGSTVIDTVENLSGSTYTWTFPTAVTTGTYQARVTSANNPILTALSQPLNYK